MSRIGKRLIHILPDVQVKINANTVDVKGPLGSLSHTFPNDVIISHDEANKTIEVKNANDSLQSRALWGTANAVIKNMIQGVKEGYKKELLIKGVGYRAKTENNNVVLSLGYSHQVEVPIPKGIKVEIDKATRIIVSGFDKVLVGQFAANIRKTRKPSPYSGKGVMYSNEIVRRKEGKTAKSAS